MVRTILGVAGGLVAWAMIATVLDHGLRHVLAGYAAAEPALALTLPMMIGRLSLAVAASLGAGAIARAIAPGSRWAPWVVGVVLLALFLPVHIRIGGRLPLWYHVFFLGTLVPWVVGGGAVAEGAGSMRNPPHPDLSARLDCLGALGLSVTEGAKILGVTRQTLKLSGKREERDFGRGGSAAE